MPSRTPTKQRQAQSQAKQTPKTAKCAPTAKVLPITETPPAPVATAPESLLTEERAALAQRVAVERKNLADAINPESPNALSDHDIENMGNFLLIVRNYYSNFATPIEDAIVNMAYMYYRNRQENRDSLTPDDLIGVIEGPDGCRGWFDEAIEITRRFQTLYAGVLDKTNPRISVEACIGEVKGQRFKSDPSVKFQNNKQQVADTVRTAREIYRLCPEAILTHNEDFEAELRQLADGPSV
jgi:hypothetical protein